MLWSPQLPWSSLGAEGPVGKIISSAPKFLQSRTLTLMKQIFFTFPFPFSTSYSQHCKKNCRILEDLWRLKESEDCTRCPRHVLNYSEHCLRTICHGLKARKKKVNSSFALNMTKQTTQTLLLCCLNAFTSSWPWVSQRHATTTNGKVLVWSLRSRRLSVTDSQGWTCCAGWTANAPFTSAEEV